MKVLFYCPRGHRGTMTVADSEWAAKTTERNCPKCSTSLHQKWMHFEDLNNVLQGERVALCLKKGPLTYHERQRLREIHAALGHRDAATLSPAQENLVMDIAGAVMFRHSTVEPEPYPSYTPETLVAGARRRS